jgi:TatD DNase family protein
MSVELFDTHAHLHFPDFAPDLADVLARARTAGVRRMVTIGTDAETSRAAVAIAERDPEVWASVGLHPHDADAGDDALFDELERLAASPRVVAIGEMGLDFFRNLSPRPAQERALRRQLALARALGKPAVIHCRDAHPETLAILEEERVRDVGGIMHCFSADVERFVPADRLVVETDCPFLPPQPYRGKRNEPSYLVLTAARVADLRKESLDTLGPRMADNARRLFGIA